MQLDLVVERDERDVVLRRVPDVRRLLARVRVHDAAGSHAQVEDLVDLGLKTTLRWRAFRLNLHDTTAVTVQDSSFVVGENLNRLYTHNSYEVVHLYSYACKK